MSFGFLVWFGLESADDDWIGMKLCGEEVCEEWDYD